VSTVFTGIRKGDAVLAALLTALGVALMVENMLADPDATTRIDSQSWLMIPVFAAATVPILWRRRNLLVVYGVTLAALLVHVLAFGWVIRCGAGLPLSFALAYAAGRLAKRWHSVALLAATFAVQALVLVRDSAAGWGIIPVTAVMAAIAWGIGAGLRRRSSTEAVAEPAPSYV